MLGISVLGCQANKNLADIDFNQGTAELTESYLGSGSSEPILPARHSKVVVESVSPDQVVDYQSIQYNQISLAECLSRALQTSEVFRDLGGLLVSSPGAATTSFDPANAYTDPRFGEEAALSEFDAQSNFSALFERNDRSFNNNFTGDGGFLEQNLFNMTGRLSKVAATGTEFFAQNSLIYDNNNQTGFRFPTTGDSDEGRSWEAIWEAGFRHPLLQVSGSLFNRIAGPNQTAGNYNGILIARTNTEISLNDFEIAVRELVSDIENAYWDLYFSYRELDAQTDARDAAFLVLEQAKAQRESERISELVKASAYEQYLRFESAIIDSLEGRPTEGTQSSSGSSGGVFRRNVGVRVAERRLRYLIGMPITDGVLLKPSDVPAGTPIVFDWDEAVSDAISHRPETRRQRWVLKQRELELVAASNFLLPRADIVGNYRIRGLGEDLFRGTSQNPDPSEAQFEGTSAFSDLGALRNHEFQFGVEIERPIGFRRGNAAVRNAKLSVRREAAILDEQERRIVLDLSNAIAEGRR